MITACDAHIVTANDSQVAGARGIHKHPAVRSRARGATLDDLREAVEIFEDIERTSRRLLGAAHPRVFDIELNLKSARAKLRAREDA